MSADAVPRRPGAARAGARGASQRAGLAGPGHRGGPGRGRGGRGLPDRARSRARTPGRSTPSASRSVLLRVPVSVRRTISPSRVARLDPCQGRLGLTNSSPRFGVSLDAQDRVGGRPVDVDVPWLGAGDTREVIFDLPTERMGRLTIGPMTLRRNGFAGLWTRVMDLGDTRDLLVTPQLHRCKGVPVRPHPRPRRCRRARRARRHRPDRAARVRARRRPAPPALGHHRPHRHPDDPRGQRPVAGPPHRPRRRLPRQPARARRPRRDGRHRRQPAAGRGRRRQPVPPGVAQRPRRRRPAGRDRPGRRPGRRAGAGAGGPVRPRRPSSAAPSW